MLNEVEELQVLRKYFEWNNSKSPFICGGSTETGTAGLPKRIIICPQEGSNVQVIYVQQPS